MDKETQQRRLLNLVKTITTRALALPSIDRETFIEMEITNFRQTSADAYRQTQQQSLLLWILQTRCASGYLP
ncbi:hypothetical protein AAII07_57655 [Microvirga sp. 0TCS3.31]